MFFYDSVNLVNQTAFIDDAETARAEARGLWNACGPCVVKGNYEFRHYPQVVVNLDDADYPPGRGSDKLT